MLLELPAVGSRQQLALLSTTRIVVWTRDTCWPSGCQLDHILFAVTELREDHVRLSQAHRLTKLLTSVTDFVVVGI